MLLDVIKVFLPATIAFIIGMLGTPALTAYLYRNELWKKKAKTVSIDGGGTPIFNQLHAHKEVGTPKLGGVVIWASALITAILLWLADTMSSFGIFDKLDFVSRDQTWIPLVTLAIGGIVGAVDDFLDIRGSIDHKAGGLSLKKRLAAVALVGLLCALWFYFKLDVSSIGLPFAHIFDLGVFFVPFFILVTLALYSGGVIDGIDGLAGGLFATMFTAYGVIAFYQQQLNLSALCATIVGALLAFLWFNIPPARFYMSETGSMALTVTLAVVAFMTDSLSEGHGIIVLPIIALPLIVTTASVILQLISKKFRNGKKIFLVAPLHHHFEAIGWPAYKVTMRYWVLGVMCAVIGVTIALLG
jgi:phospho-N-acetylmuramoyl-pentapeptide-transferase